MLVSHFELVYKPQAPGAVTGVDVERVVQGYFLEITNLEDKQYFYELEFVMSPPSSTLPQRSLAGNTIYFVDRPPGTDNQAGVLNGTINVLLSGFDPESPKLAEFNESLANAWIPFELQAGKR